MGGNIFPFLTISFKLKSIYVIIHAIINTKSA